MILALLLACGGPAAPPPELPFEARPITATALAAAFPADRVKDRAGWAKDLHAVLDSHGLGATNGNGCAAVATIEQESGYQPDPAVPGIGGFVDAWIAEKQEKYGKVGGWIFAKGFRAVLDEVPAGESRSFYTRLHAAKTERDVDVAFRAFVDHQRAKLPKPLQAAETAAQAVGLDLDDLNPITTAGCLQVKVDFAEDHARTHGVARDLVRDELYTREGCVHHGTVRLLGFEAGYTTPLHRFADYNAGPYASRNAAFQEQVATLSGEKLALDGDLVRYGDGGRRLSEPGQTERALRGLATRLGLSEGRIARDLGREKERAFEETDTWAAVRAAVREQTGEEPAYARMPDVKLASIKLAGEKTTAWFAGNVEKRYRACLARLKGG
jgi:hypothetical protein